MTRHADCRYTVDVKIAYTLIALLAAYVVSVTVQLWNVTPDRLGLTVAAGAILVAICLPILGLAALIQKRRAPKRP